LVSRADFSCASCRAQGWGSTHAKYQDVLIYERTRGEGHAQPSLEITLLMLKIANREESASVRIGPDPDDIEARRSPSGCPTIV